MESRNGYRKQNSALWRSLRDGDFEEADVWAVLKERKDSTYSKADQSPSQVQRNLYMPSAARMITRTSSSSSSSSNNNNNNTTNGLKQQQQQQSAPVKIPDWSKISHKKSKNKAHKNNYYDDSDDDQDHGVVDNGDNDGYDDDDDDDDDEYDCKVPPHEFIAERLAKSQISSFSVFEGVGRTLKGRDLSKVRNAVLTKTGFLE